MVLCRERGNCAGTSLRDLQEATIRSQTGTFRFFKFYGGSAHRASSAVSFLLLCLAVVAA